MKKVTVGFVGYSDNSKFNYEEAKKIVKEVFQELSKKYEIEYVVSGLTDQGIHGIVYREAYARKIKTVGIAPSKANEYKKFPVNKEIIVGNNFGDESQTLIDSIDVFVKIGGGEQSNTELQMAKDKGSIEIIEKEL